MPFYLGLEDMSKKDRKRTIDGLLRLRSQLDAEMPQKMRSQTLILGTWNIRNFDDNRFRNGHRTTEDLMYIAEIISRFDVVALQEICDDLLPLKKLKQLLGGQYDYIVTDITEGRSGNGERLGFMFDRDKVRFEGVAGELVLPDRMQIIQDEKKRQFSRTPFMCSFQAGWFKFMISTVHIYFGKDTGEKYERRVKEIAKVAHFLADRARTDERNHILVGDFNIKKKGSKGFNALEKKKFKTIQNNVGSNKDQTKFYDQISYYETDLEVRLADSERCNGVFQFFDSIFLEEEFDSRKPALMKTVRDKIEGIELEIQKVGDKLAKSQSENAIANHKKKIAKAKASIVEWRSHLSSSKKLKHYYLSEWRTYHASDHLPLWVELEIDFAKEYLTGLRAV